MRFASGHKWAIRSAIKFGLATENHLLNWHLSRSLVQGRGRWAVKTHSLDAIRHSNGIQTRAQKTSKTPPIQAFRVCTKRKLGLWFIPIARISESLEANHLRETWLHFSALNSTTA